MFLIARTPGNGQTDSAPLKVLILAGLPLASRKRYALAMRVSTCAADLTREGFSVLLIAPDGVWKNPVEIADLADRPKSGAAQPEGDEGGLSLGLGASFRVFLRALTLSKDGLATGPTVIVAGGIWPPVFARILVALHDKAYLHLDVAGIPQQEITLSKPRLWKLKLPVYRWLFRKEVQWADVVTTINGAHAEYLLSTYHKKPLIVRDLLPARWLGRLLTMELPKPKPEVRVLYVGSLFGSRLSNFFAALDATGSKTSIKAVVVGDGPDRKALMKQTAHLGVVFPGYQGGEDLARWLADADVCYTDVWSDIGTPVKLLEYMAAGRAVVAEDTPSTRELITNGENGLLSPRDAREIARAFARLATDPILRASLGSKARKLVEALHTTHRLAELVETYRQWA